MSSILFEMKEGLMIPLIAVVINTTEVILIK